VLAPDAAAPFEVGPALMLMAAKQRRFRLENDEEMREERAGPGGVLKLSTTGKFTGGLRLKSATSPPGAF
jgi:hypothetical protein